MIQVTILQAKKHLANLIQQALAGEEIVITKGKKPMAKLVAIPETPTPPQRRLGSAPDLILYMAEDFDAPLAEFARYMP